jgi:hypothetical protein
MFDDEIRGWTNEVRDACALFRQGDLIVTPPVFFVGRPKDAVLQVTASAEEDDEGAALIDLHRDDRPPYGLITTQSCDIDEQRPNPRFPFVQVCPVYRLPNDFDPGKLGHIRRERVGHLMLLDGPDLPPGTWVADFTIELPLEKSVLVGRTPVKAFASDERYRLLAQRLAFRRDRPALANSLIESVVESIHDWRRKLDKMQVSRAWSLVHRVFLSVQGDLLSPTAAQVVVVTERDLIFPEGAELWYEWWDGAREDASKVGINLVANRFATMQQLTAAEYTEMVPLDMTYLAD